ncbi:putative cell adhesion molecule 3-like [Homarus americanus]|uniref:Putative cell adhesion molecule 3-like n=1 Tax=Homarus americanus TaxID=6706 RepID=A0A8J5K0D0_HOMAM|nr:putative cell adhesion molecule 3-like [Homarus americanus]
MQRSDQGATGVNVQRVVVPTPGVVGRPATLECQWTTGHRGFYSVRWYKNDEQFYSFVPKNKPQVKVDHNINGVNVETREFGGCVKDSRFGAVLRLREFEAVLKTREFEGCVKDLEFRGCVKDSSLEAVLRLEFGCVRLESLEAVLRLEFGGCVKT